MAVFTLLGSGNAPVGSDHTMGTSSSLNRNTISPPPPPPLGMGKMPISSPSTLRRRMQSIEAVAMIPRESICSPVPDLFPLYCNQSAAAAVFNHKWVEEEEEEKKKECVTAEKLDQWIRESIGEIVRNIGEAPFLVQIFSQQGPSVIRLEREEATPESWPLVKKRWDQSSCVPDGVILVEELKAKEEEEKPAEDRGDYSSRTWGLVVQGRGTDCAASCYILNTCRVRSSAGFCTHFCLVRAKCFGETVDKQLGNAWLQGR